MHGDQHFRGKPYSPHPNGMGKAAWEGWPWGGSRGADHAWGLLLSVNAALSIFSTPVNV